MKVKRSQEIISVFTHDSHIYILIILFGMRNSFAHTISSKIELSNSSYGQTIKIFLGALWTKFLYNKLQAHICALFCIYTYLFMQMCTLSFNITSSEHVE